jgi:hypothetical protein
MRGAAVGATATADIVRDAFGCPAAIDADGSPFANRAVEGILVGEGHAAGPRAPTGTDWQRGSTGCPARGGREFPSPGSSW